MIPKRVKVILLISPLLVLATGLLYWYNPNFIDFSAARDARLQFTDLPQFDLLRNTFESDSGYVRLIMQLSPT